MAMNASRHARRGVLSSLLQRVRGHLGGGAFAQCTRRRARNLLRIRRRGSGRRAERLRALPATSLSRFQHALQPGERRHSLRVRRAHFAVLEKMFKRKAKLDKVIATKLDFPLIRSPFAAITQSNREMIKMGETLQEMMADLRRCELKDDDSHKFRDRVFEDEEHLDKVQSEVISFPYGTLSTRVSQSIAADAERELA